MKIIIHLEKLSQNKIYCINNIIEKKNVDKQNKNLNLYPKIMIFKIFEH